MGRRGVERGEGRGEVREVEEEEEEREREKGEGREGERRRGRGGREEDRIEEEVEALKKEEIMSCLTIFLFLSPFNHKMKKIKMK